MFSKIFGNMNYHLEMQPLAHAHCIGPFGIDFLGFEIFVFL